MDKRDWIAIGAGVVCYWVGWIAGWFEHRRSLNRGMTTYKCPVLGCNFSARTNMPDVLDRVRDSHKAAHPPGECRD